MTGQPVSNTAQFGLSGPQLTAIRQIFSHYPDIQSVTLYGSRAMERYRPGSDIDLVISGTDFSHQQLLQLMNGLDDLMLPFRFDLCRHQDISNPDLLQHIERVGRLFYQKI
ncbi:MAG: nucleotidyltransferase domain-containing protein [Rheinheimera sp.]|nr:nucleotidyltransferase domain-containing protein [Rheinheimera sp.]